MSRLSFEERPICNVEVVIVGSGLFRVMSTPTPTPTPSSTCNGTEESDDRYYIISFSYGILIALILAHVAVHHLWRQRNLKRNQTTVVEIAGNTSKKLKEEVYSWCNKVKNLTPNPKLISTGASPVEYGNEFGDGPTHWFRMKAYDSATEFVLNYRGLLSDSKEFSDFPELVQDFQTSGKLSENVDAAINLYEFARYKPGDFGEQHYKQFVDYLSYFKRSLSPEDGEWSLSAHDLDLSSRQREDTEFLLTPDTQDIVDTPV
ncbi:uncharacterized protein [Dysidea avara]|uniref:uncharacterized protein n=1 Tax=Dysidea avara TaxID=196820 RepID=UPI0033309424